MPARFQVRYTKSAEHDVEEIWEFISLDNPESATRFILEMEEQIGKLEHFPERCPFIRENEILGTRYRHFLFGNYRAIYRVSDRTVHVLRIVHSARLLDTSAFGLIG
jgi:plasmid stabilization system protein ParE